MNWVPNDPFSMNWVPEKKIISKSSSGKIIIIYFVLGKNLNDTDLTNSNWFIILV